MRAFTPAAESLRKRLPWLGVNLVTAFLAAAVPLREVFLWAIVPGVLTVADVVAMVERARFALAEGGANG